MCYFKIYCTLPNDAKFIRETVFMNEQGFVNEFDEKDAIAKHLVLYDDTNRPIATCRFFPNKEGTVCFVGRIAVLKAFRQKSYGAVMLREVERQIKNTTDAKEIRLAAQVRAKEFYEKSGYATVGSVFLEEGCPHIWMYKSWR